MKDLHHLKLFISEQLCWIHKTLNIQMHQNTAAAYPHPGSMISS